MNMEIEKKIDALIEKMTVREKVGQLNQIKFTEKEFDEVAEKIRKGEVGSLILAGDEFAGHSDYQMSKIDVLNKIQQIAVEESPNGIPVINGKDVIHGYNTGYPIPLACASSFNMELIEKSFAAAGREAASEGVHWSFAPMMDISRDPRWGRIIEGAGEDPYLDGKCAAAAVKGFQGDNMADEGKIVACAKHYVGYGASEGGRDYHKTEISDYTLRNIYLPPFREAVKAGVSTVMSSFNEISGQPVTSSRYLLTDVLRGEFGFEGYVISDWDAVIQLIGQGVAESRRECAKLALNAGLDMDMVDGCYIENVESLIESGEVSMETLDESVRRILRIKFAAGLFDNPYFGKIEVDYGEHMKIAEEISRESMVLLKNDGVLPLDKDADVCLSGPFADEKKNVLGSWTAAKSDWTVTILDGMKKVGKNVKYVSDDIPLEAQMEFRRHDVVVLAVGESRFMSGEMRSLANLELPDETKALAEKARLYGKKVVGVFCCGRPLALQSVEPYFDAILYAWHSGNAIGTAAADILYGNVCPSGRTAVTFPRVTGQVPLYYNVPSSGRPVNDYYYSDKNSFHNYQDCYGSPMYPFGFGLSYTEFEYSAPTADTETMSISELRNGRKFKVSLDVENVGKCGGKETVQCYIRDKVASMTRPLRELKGFEKTFIGCGETKHIEFELGFEELGFYRADGKFDAEPGDFEIYTGKNCLDCQMITVKVTE